MEPVSKASFILFEASLKDVIREKDGIHFNRGEVVADSRKASGEKNVVTHAHFDHMHQDSSNEVICSELTGKLFEARLDEEFNYRTESEGLELINSGHILGSSAVKFEMNGETVLYTGDASTRDRAYMEGFDPPQADVLVMETTYGIPNYRFPAQEKIEKNIREWVQENQDRPLILFGYSLGKAQKIQHIVEKFTDREIIAHGAVKKMNDVVEEVSDLKFSARPYGENKDVLEDNGILIAPSNTSQADWVEKVVEEYDALKAGFSGWAVSDSFKYRGGYDETFVLSDHCDFDELIEMVEKVDPERVYTLHGFDEAFASHLKKERGINARALKRNQASLTDF